MPQQFEPRGPEGGPLGGGGPDAPLPPYAPNPGWDPNRPYVDPYASGRVAELPPGLELTDIRPVGTSRGGIPLYQATDQSGRQWHWSRGNYGGYWDKDGNWHEVDKQDGVWRDEWTDKDGNEHHGRLDPQGNWVDTWMDANSRVHEGYLAEGEWHELPLLPPHI